MHYSAPQISHIPAQPGFERLYPIGCTEDASVVEIGRDPIIGWRISTEVSERRGPDGEHKILTQVLPLTAEGEMPSGAYSAVKRPDGAVYYDNEGSTFPDEESMLEFWVYLTSQRAI